MQTTKPMTETDYLECERWFVFLILNFIGGFFGAFTYSIRGGVFCNAQTANFVLSAMALGNGDLKKFLYYFIPMTAYFMGAFLSEHVPDAVRQRFHIRWDTLFIAIEMLAVIILALIPESAPFRISQILINFITAMQYNTFRQAQGVPVATTFCTNHLRQVGVSASKFVRFHDKKDAWRMFLYCRVLFFFVLGAVCATILCRYFLGRAMLFVLPLLGFLFVDLLREDLHGGQLERIPRGH